MFGCLHQQSPGRHRFTKIVKMGEASPIKQWCKIIIIIMLTVILKKNGKITLNTALGSSWV